MSKRYENLEKAMCNELDKLDKKYGSESTEMSPSDLEHADMIYHALKSAATYHAMVDAEEEMDDGYSGYGRMYRSGRAYPKGSSYRRMRDSRGRFVSRDMGGDGYSGGYPMEYIDPYWDRRY